MDQWMDNALNTLSQFPNWARAESPSIGSLLGSVSTNVYQQRSQGMHALGTHRVLLSLPYREWGC